MDQIRIGALVMIIHEVCDITYPLCRFYFDYKNKNKTIDTILGVNMLVTWIMFIFFLN